MNKTIIRAAVALSLTTSFLSGVESDLPLKITSIYENDGWNLVEDIFITQARAHVDTLKENGKRFAIAALINGTTNYCLNIVNGTRNVLRTTARTIVDKVSPKLSKSVFTEELNIIPYQLFGTPTARIVATASFIFMRKKALRAAELRQMEKVMLSWPELRAKFPEKLRAAFDTLHTLSKKESAAEEYQALLPDAVRLTKEAVASHFTEKNWYSFLPQLVSRAVNSVVN